MSEKPKLENQKLDKPTLEKPTLENPTQLNIKEENTEQANTVSAVNQSVTKSEVIKDCQTDGETDELQSVLNSIDWSLFKKPIREMFEQVIERLYYTEKLKIGQAVLPNKTVRAYLRRLNEDVLIGVLDSMKHNKQRVVNPTGYLASVIINAVSEQESDTILSLPPDYISESDLYEKPDDGG